MRFAYIFICGMLVLLSTNLSAQSFVGKWLVEKKDAHVVIYKKGNRYYGKVYKIGGKYHKNGKPVLDVKNPNPSKRSRKIQGHEFLSGFELIDDKLVNGRLYDARSGRSYKGKIWHENGKLKVRGYLGIFYETREWTRTK